MEAQARPPRRLVSRLVLLAVGIALGAGFATAHFTGLLTPQGTEANASTHSCNQLTFLSSTLSSRLVLSFISCAIRSRSS